MQYTLMVTYFDGTHHTPWLTYRRGYAEALIVNETPNLFADPLLRWAYK